MFYQLRYVRMGNIFLCLFPSQSAPSLCTAPSARCRARTSALVDLVEGEARRGEHPHVGPELLNQRIDHVLGGGVRRHADAFGGHLLAGVLVVEPAG